MILRCYQSGGSDGSMLGLYLAALASWTDIILVGKGMESGWAVAGALSAMRQVPVAPDAASALVPG